MSILVIWPYEQLLVNLQQAYNLEVFITELARRQLRGVTSTTPLVPRLSPTILAQWGPDYDCHTLSP